MPLYIYAFMHFIHMRIYVNNMMSARVQLLEATLAMMFASDFMSLALELSSKRTKYLAMRQCEILGLEFNLLVNSRDSIKV